MTEFNESVTETIRRRCSWRSYSGEPVQMQSIGQMKDFMDKLPEPPFGSKTRFDLFRASDMKEKITGTYGVIRGADTFIAGAVKDNPRAMEDYGFQFEKIILFATNLGLATCWLGGTFNRTQFAQRLMIQNDEIIPAVSPLGYTADKRTIIDKGFRFFAGSKTRKPFGELFFKGSFDFSLKESEAGEYAIPMEMVRLAPSASNKQPWRMILKGSMIHLVLVRTEGYAKMLPVDIQKIDMGIAMAHFELTARQAGLSGHWVESAPDIKLPGLAEYSISWEMEK